MAIIGRISSCELVIYVFIVPTKINITVLFHYPKQKRWFSHLIHDFEIRILYPFSPKVILLNHVSGFIGKISNLKHDILNYQYGYFQY